MQEDTLPAAGKVRALVQHFCGEYDASEVDKAIALDVAEQLCEQVCGAVDSCHAHVSDLAHEVLPVSDDPLDSRASTTHLCSSSHPVCSDALPSLLA